MAKLKLWKCPYCGKRVALDRGKVVRHSTGWGSTCPTSGVIQGVNDANRTKVD